MKTVIKIEGLGKQYRLGFRGTGALVHDLNRWWLKTTGKEDIYNKVGQTINVRNFWALQDINFELSEGDVLGVIGKNGAGKSTLLKILSRVTSPTAGKVMINGKLSSLLEVGTGFHPELSGRENVFLNGAILGMTKQQIFSKFDEIVEFAGVSQFIDTPVKRYSSGMYVRLAFAVAAHLDADILIVDEVLAVGDAEFQKKCLGKMKEVSQSGRTIIFVSHNMTSIKSLCNKCFVLNEGSMFHPLDMAQNAITAYTQSLFKANNDHFFENETNRIGNGKARFSRLYFNQHNIDTLNPETGSRLEIRMVLMVKEPINNCIVSISFNTTEGENKMLLFSELVNKSYNFNSGEQTVTCGLDKNPLQEGNYSVNLFLKSGNDIVDWLQQATVVNVTAGDFYGTGRYITNGNSSILVDQQWK